MNKFIVLRVVVAILVIWTAIDLAMRLPPAHSDPNGLDIELSGDSISVATDSIEILDTSVPTSESRPILSKSVELARSAYRNGYHAGALAQVSGRDVEAQFVKDSIRFDSAFLSGLENPGK